MRTSLIWEVVLGTAGLLIFSGAGCGSSDILKSDSADASGENNVGKSSSPIINGTVDNTHTAVVAIINASDTEVGKCSGTIIKVDPNNHIGWVLTAAHCVDPEPLFVVQAADYMAYSEMCAIMRAGTDGGQDCTNTNAIGYQVIDYAADPRYQLGGDAAQPYDVAVLRIGGVDSTTPSIPITGSEDGLALGSTVTAIGFGTTTLPEAGTDAGSNDENSKRMETPLAVTYTDNTFIGYDFSTHAFCFGDSGGPDLFNNRVVGVHSATNNCKDNIDIGGYAVGGISGRVSGNLDFINTQLNTLPDCTCDACETIVTSGNQQCAPLASSFYANPDLVAFETCFANATTSSGQASCLQQYPEAGNLFTAVKGCISSSCAVCGGGAAATCKLTDIGISPPNGGGGGSSGCSVGQQDARSTHVAGSIFVLLSLVGWIARRRRR
ncbi:MAG: S1 family peptidase [Polyangiaceae bacterium]|nr:S1 family peptidase [Polyangiaceae bacterium]